MLADQWLPDLPGAELLSRVRTMHPDARRALLVPWGAWSDRPTAEAILRAMAMGDINYYVLKPWSDSDELFNRTVGEFVHEWSRTVTSAQREVVVVAERRAPRGHGIRSLLTRNGIPHAFLERGTPRRRRHWPRSACATRSSSTGPVVVWMPALGGTVLLDPTDAEICEAWGIATTLPGRGPRLRRARRRRRACRSGGLGLRLVRGSAACWSSSGRRSAGRRARARSSATTSASRGASAAPSWPSGATSRPGCSAPTSCSPARSRAIRRRTDGFEADISAIGRVSASTVVLATGVAYRRLGIPELEALSGAGVYYGASVSEAQALAGLHLVVLGGGNSAGQAVLHLQRYAADVRLVVRAAALEEGMSQYLVDEIEADPGITVHLDSEVVGGGGEGWLQEVVIARPRTTGERQTRVAPTGSSS